MLAAHPAQPKRHSTRPKWGRPIRPDAGGPAAWRTWDRNDARTRSLAVAPRRALQPGVSTTSSHPCIAGQRGPDAPGVWGRASRGVRRVDSAFAERASRIQAGFSYPRPLDRPVERDLPSRREAHNCRPEGGAGDDGSEVPPWGAYQWVKGLLCAGVSAAAAGVVRVFESFSGRITADAERAPVPGNLEGASMR